MYAVALTVCYILVLSEDLSLTYELYLIEDD